MEEEKLIESVRKYEFLYNLQHPKYMDTQRKETAWKEISEEQKQPVAACKQKWQALRDAYRRALNKKKGKSGQAAKKQKKWKYEEEMSFVAPFFADRKTLESVELTSDEECSDNEPLETQNNGVNHAVADVAGSEKTVDTEIQKEDANRTQNNIQQLSQRKNLRRKTKIQQVPSASAILMEKLLEERNYPPQCQHDGIDRFFLNIADTVKTFSPYQQALAKNKIFTLVSEMELQQFTNPNFNHSPHYAFSNAYETPPLQSTASPVSQTATPMPTSPENWSNTSSNNWNNQLSNDLQQL